MLKTFHSLIQTKNVAIRELKEIPEGLSHESERHIQQLVVENLETQINMLKNIL